MLPFTTTTATVERPVQPTSDPFVEPTWTTVATGVRCVIGAISGAERRRSQLDTTAVAHFAIDQDVRSYDRITDELTNETYQAGELHKRMGFGLDHLRVNLSQVKGAVDA